MVTLESRDDRPDGVRRGFWPRSFFTTDHRVIGLNYLWLALASVFIGMAMSLVMRLRLVWPGAQLALFSGFASVPERYAALALLHGSLMVFIVLTAAPQAGLGGYLLPTQIGAREMAFPAVNLLAFWTTVASLVGITAAFFLQPERGITLWTCSVGLFCAASAANALSFAVTMICLRAKGMTLPRLPVTVWAWFLNAVLGLLIFSILLAACVYLLADRMLGTHLFDAFVLPASDAFPTARAGDEPIVLWHRLFWFFAQAQVYLAMLPCFGIATHLLATFSRRRLWAQRAVVLALCGVGVVGFCIWGQHMFASGLNPYSPLVFSLLAASLGLPASVLVLSWFGTLWNAKTRLNTAMLFALGFISLFLSGGLSGILLSRHDLAATSASDDLISGHFHLVMGVAATFAMLAALFFWFPAMFARRLDERLGKIHFWLTFVGVYCVFMPMHWLGLISHGRIIPGAESAAFGMASLLQSLTTGAMLITIAAQAIFLLNLAKTLTSRERATEENPWRATTLEWATLALLSDAPLTAAPVVYRAAYEFGVTSSGQDFLPQHLPPTTDDLRTRIPDASGGSVSSATRPAASG